MQENVTPVYRAAAVGQVRALKALIRAGADLNAANMVSIECVTFYICLYYTVCCSVIWNNLNVEPNTHFSKKIYNSYRTCLQEFYRKYMKQ